MLELSYVPLHVHTDASSDGAGTVEKLVKRAKEMNFTHLAMTDHGTLANAVAFWSACNDNEIIPIMGLEAYLSYRGKRHHITLHALNEAGFHNLVQLNSWSHVDNYTSGYPLITLDSLHRFRGDLQVLTGCASSAIHEEHGIEYVSELIDVMGDKSLVISEVMFVGTHDVWSKPLDIAKKLGLSWVITNDTHYPCRNQFHAHQSITKARKGFTYNSSELWLKSGDEIYIEATKYLESKTSIEGLSNSLFLAACVHPWSMKRKPSLPVIPNCVEKLREALKENLRHDVEGRTGFDREQRLKRLQYEFHILNEKGFLDYIYILTDIVSWAKSNGIYTGPGRGSGGGSYLLYLLGITRIDPIDYGLLFERFINPSRGDYPDVDIDIEADRRQEVLNYAKERWGAVPIATYSCYSHKSAIHDIARTLVIPKSLEDAAADVGRDSDIFDKFINAHPDALETYNTMLGQIRHRGKHAAGVIITDHPIPIERSGDDLVAAWAEGMNTKDLSKVGIVKFDILSLSALSQLRWLEETTGDECPHYGDDKVYNLFCEGDVSGIFQWTGSDGIRNLTKRIAPRNFKDLATINALYRPGALDAGTAEDYPDYMKEPRVFGATLIDDILAETYGVICFQEQVQQLIAVIMGGDLYAADTARRLLTKSDVGNPKWEAEMAALKADFFRKGEKFYKEDLLELLWFEIYKHSRYSFNKSHAFAYTMISYELAYFKCYHRAAFTTAMLKYDKGNAQTYLLDAVSQGLFIGFPDINYSTSDYTLHDGGVYLPLSDVAYVGETAVEFIVKEREANGPYLSYEDFSKRVPKRTCNNRSKGMLERIGAFSKFTDEPTKAIDKYAELAITGPYQTQLEVLGYVIPTPKLIKKMNEVMSLPCKKDEERFVGFVTKAEDRESEKGAYRVYTLSPFGSFWMRPPDERVQVGSFISGVKNFYGHGKELKVYRLGGD